MISGKNTTAETNESAGVSGVIKDTALESSEETLVHQKQTLIDGIDRHEMIAAVAYHRAKLHGSNNDNEIQGWIKNGVSINDNLYHQEYKVLPC